MKQNQNNIDCAPSKDEEGVAKCLIQMCKDSNAGITSFSMSCEDGYEVTISARKKGKRIYNEFSRRVRGNQGHGRRETCPS